MHPRNSQKLLGELFLWAREGAEYSASNAQQELRGRLTKSTGARLAEALRVEHELVRVEGHDVEATTTLSPLPQAKPHLGKKLNLQSRAKPSQAMVSTRTEYLLKFLLIGLKKRISKENA